MENGTIEQDGAGAVDSEGSITDGYSNGESAGDGALDDGQLAGEGEQFDRNSPESRYWQSQKDKEVGELKTQLARLESRIASGRLQQQPQAPNEPTLDDIMDFDAFQVPSLPAGELENLGFDDRSLAAIDRRSAEIARHVARHVLASVTAHNQRSMAAQQQGVAAQKIGAFVDANGEHGQAILRLYDEMPDLAARNPDRFISIAKSELGLAERAPQQSPRRGLASAVSQSSTRPTRNGNAPVRTQPPSSIRDAVANAIDGYMKRKGG